MSHAIVIITKADAVFQQASAIQTATVEFKSAAFQLEQYLHSTAGQQLSRTQQDDIEAQLASMEDEIETMEENPELQSLADDLLNAAAQARSMMPS